MIQIIFGSGGGNTEFLCDLLNEKLLKAGNKVVLSKAKVTKFDDLLGAKLYILASPTYGHGLLEKYMDKFVRSFAKSHFDMKGSNFAVIGLGNKKYDDDYYIESANILEDFVRENGGNLVVDTLRVGGCVYDDLDKKLDSFVLEILNWINE